MKNENSNIFNIKHIEKGAYLLDVNLAIFRYKKRTLEIV